MKRTPLKRTTQLKRRPWRKALGTAEQRLRFKQDVLAADGHRCILAGLWTHQCDGPLQAAHVVRKHTLRKRGYGAEVVYSVGAAMTLCQAAHEEHDAWVTRVPDSLIPDRCLRFARLYGEGK